MLEFDPADPFAGLRGDTPFEQLVLILLRQMAYEQRQENRRIAELERRLQGLEGRSVIYGSIAGTLSAIVIGMILKHLVAP